MKFSIVFFVLFLLLGSFLEVGGQADVTAIEVNAMGWNKMTLYALTVENTSEPWWQPYFVNLTQRAIMQWNQAIQFFAENFPQYGYLSQFNIISDVGNEKVPGYDIYINFTGSLPNQGVPSADTLGLTSTASYLNGTIKEVDVTILANNTQLDLTRSNQRDICDHELGHALGLGHCNSSSDLMYPYYDIYSRDNAISTLDLYAIAELMNPIKAVANNTKSALSGAVVLPQNVPYQYAPISNPAPKSLEDNPIVRFLNQLFSDPTSAAAITVSLVAFILIAVYAAMKRRQYKR